MNTELEKIAFSRFGSEGIYVKQRLGRYITAIKMFFKKLKFVQIIFQIDFTRQASAPWYAPYPYVFEVYVIDNFGNAYRANGIPIENERYLTGSVDIVTVPDVPPGLTSKFQFRTYNGALIDEDAILASDIPLTDAQISFIKSGIPSTIGTAITGVESQIPLLFQMLPLLQNIAKETHSVYFKQ